MNRPTKEITLPVSKIKVELYTYYLRGDKKAIEAIMTDSANIRQKDDGEDEIKLDLSYRAKMEDKAVILAIKSLKDSEGKEMEVNIETLDQLPDEDWKEIYANIPDQKPKKK